MKEKFEVLKRDIQAVLDRDPATNSKFEAILCSSGLHAIMMHRVWHFLWNKNWHITARFFAQITRFLTGIEIHPAAKIGYGFFIDHGMGVVIGETAQIGNNVTMYHDVTLGGTTVFDAKGKVMHKRHPTIGNGVIIGSGAQVLGPITIGNNVKIGSNAIVVHDVTPNTTVVGVAAHKTQTKEPKNKKFCAYAVSEAPDPVDEKIDYLLSEIQEIKQKIEKK